MVLFSSGTFILVVFIHLDDEDEPRLLGLSEVFLPFRAVEPEIINKLGSWQNF